MLGGALPDPASLLPRVPLDNSLLVSFLFQIHLSRMHQLAQTRFSVGILLASITQGYHFQKHPANPSTISLPPWHCKAVQLDLALWCLEIQCFALTVFIFNSLCLFNYPSDSFLSSVSRHCSPWVHSITMRFSHNLLKLLQNPAHCNQLSKEKRSGHHLFFWPAHLTAWCCWSSTPIEYSYKANSLPSTCQPLTIPLCCQQQMSTQSSSPTIAKNQWHPKIYLRSCNFRDVVVQPRNI